MIVVCQKMRKELYCSLILDQQQQIYFYIYHQMLGMTQATSGDTNIFYNQRQLLKRTNMTVVQMNKSKIKFLNKYLSKSQMGVYKSVENTNKYTTEQISMKFGMKEKFQDLYKRIQKISRNVKNQQIDDNTQKQFIVAPNQQIANKKSFIFKNSQTLKNDLLKFRLKSKQTKVVKVQQQKQTQCDLQINTKTNSKQQRISHVRILGLNRQRPRLVSISRPVKMSNSIKDYLSVQKIKLKDLQDSILEKQHNITQKTKVNKLRNSLYSELVTSFSSEIQSKMILPVILPEKGLQNQPNSTMVKYNLVTRFKKFEPPFETYFYRDLLWRVAYSNEKILQFPQQYEYKIKVYVGKGNNSRLVKSIIARRPWFQVTEKMQQAQFIWTQIKVSSVFSSQLKNNTKNEDSKYTKEIQNTDIYLQSQIWTNFQQKAFNKYFYAYKNAQMRMRQNMKFRNRNISKVWQTPNGQEKKESQDLSQTKSSLQYCCASMPSIGLNANQNINTNTIPKVKVHNHFINSFLIGNKKALFQTMSDYYANKGDDVFNYLPLTFHICNGLEDQKYLKFLNYYYIFAKKSTEQNKDSKFNAWIVKPGQNTNRGQGITVCLTLQSIKNILKKKDKHNDGSNKTYIVQKYIQRPMLYKKRKFDIRHYIMINCSNGYVKGYWFKQGYVRTTSSQYSLKQGLGSVHLTNDAVQKNLPDYGKYQKGNKISYEELEQYISKINNKFSFWTQAYPQMKKIATDVIRASATNLDSERRTNFQIYGLDFMIDEEMQVWLIQVNTNPCLQLSCPLLAKIIPKMVENTLQICLDSTYPPPTGFNPKGQTFKINCLQETGYQLVYDDRFQQTNKPDARLLNDQNLRIQEDDCFQDDGEDWNQD